MNKREDHVGVGLIFALACTVAFVVFFLVDSVGEKNKLLEERDLLQSEKIDLEIEVEAQAAQIFELELELSNTERTLAETAHELEILQDIEHNYKEVNLKYVGQYYCTSYCTEKYSHICGTGSGNTASGAPVTANVSVATTDFDTFSYGTVIYIEGVGIRIIQDTGGFEKNKLDVAVKTHDEATHWKGQGKHRVWIVEVKDE